MKKVLVLLSVLILVGCSNMDSLYKTISGKEARELIKNTEVIVIDVRTKEEYESGHITNSINIPLNTITKSEIEMVASSIESSVVVYCRSGKRSKQAAQILINLGYTNVYDLGSIDNWGDINEQ